MHYALAPIIGALITLMNALNSRFAISAGSWASVVVVHVVGLIAVCAALIVRPEKASPGRLPLHLYSGGIVGVVTILACNAAYGNMGASLAVAIALFGQTVFSVAADATGFLGRKKYPLSARALPGLFLAAAGIAIIAGGRFENAAYAPFALLAGCLPVLAFIANSQLAERIGVFRSTRVNYVVGLGTTLALIAGAAAASALFGGAMPAGSGRALAAAAGAGVSAILGAGPVIVLGGGLLGVIVVAGINIFFPRIPALYATLLMFSGQAVAGVLAEAVSGGAFEVRKLLGTLVVLAGLGANAMGNAKRS